MSLNICTTLGSNLGKPTCDVRMKRPKYILLSYGKIFSASELASPAAFKAALKTAMNKANSDPEKVWCSPLLRVVDDNTSDPNVASLADGYEEVLNESLPNYLAQTTAGVAQILAFCSFNGFLGTVFIVDVDNVLWYRVTSNLGGQGFTVGNLYTNPPRWGNSSNITTSGTRLVFGEIDEFKSDIGAIKIDFNPSKLVNIEDVELVEKDAPATNVFTIGGITKYTKIDIYDKYKTGLANVNRWVVKRLDTGATLTVTSVTADDTNKGWDITIDNTEFTGLPSNTVIQFNTAAPGVLETAGVLGIEGLPITYVKS